MEEIKVNHQRTFDKMGCVYQRGFKISYKIFRDFFIHLQGERKKTKNAYVSLHLNSKFESTGDCQFMNLTQTELFVKWALKNEEIKINEKRAKLKANGYLIIK